MRTATDALCASHGRDSLLFSRSNCRHQALPSYLNRHNELSQTRRALKRHVAGDSANAISPRPFAFKWFAKSCRQSEDLTLPGRCLLPAVGTWAGAGACEWMIHRLQLTDLPAAKDSHMVVYKYYKYLMLTLQPYTKIIPEISVDNLISILLVTLKALVLHLAKIIHFRQ